ncbi:KAP family P-loop domain-containing protein [Candidatus Electrothrix aarhusensis]|uniref:KAP family P-loop domain-containing protein n=1 Tax=Candidatus Electrothrix aarhusensis TaxID=1859131 RepID=A0A3S3QJX8_9BACT|nr:KAP family P-loop domain-containing protein [Candidatus Electrothrix aarhusensis]
MSRYSNDEWTLVDTLGYGPFIQQLLGLIEKAQPPFSIGIYGGWGTGKTSIMRQLFFRTGGRISSVLLPLSEDPVEEHLDPRTIERITEFRGNNTKMRAVWFNPWQHQFDNDPIIGLLHEIRENFDLFSQVGEEAKKLADVSVRGGLDILSSIINKLTTAKVDPGKLEQYGEKYEAKQFAVKSSSQRFRLLFEKAIEKLLGGKDGEQKTLVVYIDDLDRCTDTNTIKLIEGIKLYLATSNCVFVFGMDQVNVLRALEHHQIHKDYLDKLFQSIIRIPLSKKYPALIREIVGDYFPDVYTDGLTRLLNGILEKNPRKVKNFLNSFRSYWELLNLSTDDRADQPQLRIEIAALFHYLRIYCEPVFTVLERHPDYIAALSNVCQSNPPDQNVERLFYEYLRNPIIESTVPASDDETEELVPEGRLSKEDLEYMKDISPRYESLDYFKTIFVESYRNTIADYDQETLNRYLGVIDHA